MGKVANRILVLFAHPSPRRSEVGVHMARVAEWVPGVDMVDLYAEYPALDIDIEIEQRRCEEHDVIVFQHPFYWYSVPPILKQWQDLVLEYGWAYGKDGTALIGKTLFCAITTGGPSKAYTRDGYNQFTMRELLAPLEQTATLCGMRWLPPFVLHGARSAKEDGRIEDHLEAWETLLEQIVHGRFDFDAAAGADYLEPGMAEV